MERIFLGWERPALLSAAERLLPLGGPPPGPVDLRRFSLLLPGARAGRQLIEALTHAAAALGRGVLPPRVWTPRALLEGTRGDAPALASAADERLAWSTALLETERDRLGDLLPGSGVAPPGAVTRLANRLESLARELGAEGISPRELLDGAARHGDPAESRRLQVFVDIATRAESRLESAGRRGGWHGRLADRHEDPGPVIAIGVADPRRRLREVLDGLPQVEVWIHAPESEAAHFGRCGELIEAAREDVDLPFPDAAFEIADTPTGQAALAVARIVAAEAAGIRPTVCVLDPEVRPLLVDQLDRLGGAVHDAAGTPWGRSRPGQGVTALRRLLEENEFGDLARWLRHPDIEAALAPLGSGVAGTSGAGWLERLDTAHADALPVWTEDLARSGYGREIGAAVSAHLTPLSGPPRPAPEWADAIAGWVTTVWGDDREDRALERTYEGIDTLAAIPPALAPPIGSAAALRLLEATLVPQRVPEPPRSGALELVDWLEVELDPAATLLLVGVNEGFLPGSGGGPDALLSPRVRMGLGLPGPDRRAARDTAALRAVLASDRRITCIAGRRSGDREPRHPSRFWLADGETRPSRVCEFYDESGDPFAPAALMATEGSASLEIPRPEPPAEPRTRVSVTGLGEYLACPYTFYLHRIRRLEESDDAADELDPRAFGNLVHGVLESLAATPEVRDGDDPEAIETFLLDSLGAAVRRRYGERPAAAVRVQSAQIAERLRPFARWHADQVRIGWRLIRGEAAIPAETPNFPVEGIEFTLTGTIDRIERHETDGRWRIIDYKTGEAGDDPRRVHRVGRGAGARWKSLQLPLYRELAPLLGDHLHGTSRIGDGAPIEVGFVVLPRDVKRVGYLSADWSDEEHEDALATARQTLLRIHRGEFWPPGRWRAPWDRIFAGETAGALDRFIESGELEEGA